MKGFKNTVDALDARLDMMGKRLAAKEIRIPTELCASVFSLLFALVVLLLTPSQVEVSEGDVVNGQVFPVFLMVIVMICGGLILAQQLIKLARKQPLAMKTINLLTEVKALLILVILGGFFLICQFTGIFALGACFCVLGFMLFFRCKKWSYYVITLAAAVLIWAAFRFGLNVYF